MEYKKNFSQNTSISLLFAAFVFLIILYASALSPVSKNAAPEFYPGLIHSRPQNHTFQGAPAGMEHGRLSIPLQETTGFSLWSLIYAAFVGAIAFAIFKTGDISRYRSIFFITLAAGFILNFKLQLYENTGQILWMKTAEAKEVPYCHIAASGTLVDIIVNQARALWGDYARAGAAYSLSAIWLLMTLALGQGFCSWACYYGGIDECFSKISGKQRLKINDIPKGLRELNLGILLFAALASFAMMQPVFCLWLCPLKMTTGFLDLYPDIKFIQAGIFMILGISFLVVLPLLTKKRAFCGMICPFGAWQSLVGNINPYRVIIDDKKCTDCKNCIRACPVFAISAESLKERKVLSRCNRCGACMGACPEAAINYGISKSSCGSMYARNLFILSAIIFSGVIGGAFVPSGISKLIGLIWQR